MTIESLLKTDQLNQRKDLISIVRTGIETKHLKSVQDFTGLMQSMNSKMKAISGSVLKNL